MKLWFHDTYTNLKQLCSIESKNNPNVKEKCLANYEYEEGDSFGLMSDHIRHIITNNFNIQTFININDNKN